MDSSTTLNVTTPTAQSPTRTVVYVLITVVGLLVIIISTSSAIVAVWLCRRKQRQKTALQKHGTQYVHNNLAQNNDPSKKKSRSNKVSHDQQLSKKDAWLEQSNGIEKLDNISLNSYRSNLDTITEENTVSSKSVSNSSSLSDLSKLNEKRDAQVTAKVMNFSQSMDNVGRYCDTISEMISKSTPQLNMNRNKEDSVSQVSHL